MDLSRRSFLVKGGLGLAASALSPSLLAQEAESRFQLALSQYSLRVLFKYNYLKTIDFAHFTADKFGIKAIDLWEGGLPKDKLDDHRFLEKMRKRADLAGVDLFLHMAGVLQSPPKKFQQSYDKIIKSLDRAKILGVDFLRIFLYAENMQDAQTAMTKLCDEAAKREIKIIIEPNT